MLAVRIRRGEGPQGFQTFAVPRRANQTVLDVVTEIQRDQDPTLSYRFACRVGMCGSCGMTVNGRPRWTCRTRVAQVAEGESLTLEPLRNLPVVKDLTVDMEPFFTKWRDAHGYFEPGETPADDFATVLPDSAERQEVDAGIECINCGVCYAACDVVSWNPDYLGPAALNRAWTLVNDVRDRGQAERLAAVSTDAGCHACHSHMSCTEHCPKGLAPTFAIAGLKRETARAALRRFRRKA
ncbi:Fumarate reductase iron-sulfur subunit [Methylobacterium trifolii]|uniref:Fumarate reductase iron-sulfur subunit n=2 Tax=Methylobacterium trifolii TaxID=1003092 RepID=A0ABQ4TTG0_9HYPH|nr:succinate dehydrogenase/fumarate reductase iron-sulfur subunit [Methylobacterium trifolii]GJE58022.1 Fumarate reductase iron-sulfur subunit [Methylobacterium trifolii]